MTETRWWERIIGALMLLAIALLVSGAVRALVPKEVEPAQSLMVLPTTWGDTMVTHVPDDRILRVELDRMPQDYLLCLGERCLLPAEWREGVGIVLGPGAAKIRVMTALGVREFWVTTIAGTAGVVFTPAEQDPIAKMQ